jgi:hypothetical protein
MFFVCFLNRQVVFQVFIFKKVPLSWLTVDEGMKTFRNSPLKEEEALLWRYQPH